MPGAKKPPTAKSNMSAREMWLQAVKGRSSTLGANNRKGGLSSTKKTPNEYWVGSLRRSQGLQNEIAAMDTFGKGGPSGEAVPYLSTSHYLRERVGVEKTNKRASASADLRAAPGTPAYKTPEEYYDEVLELRKQIGGLDKDNSLLRAKLRRVEEDNLKKEKEIETLMDPTKSGDLRRTLTDRKPDSSAVVHSLKQKIMKLEQQLREKESTISTLKSDLKSTNVDEIRLKMEMFYQEIMRLQNSRAPVSAPQTTTSKSSSKSGKEPKESSSKIKALNDTILRMNEKNVRLTAENKSLKEDLDKLMAQLADTKEKKLEYEEMSRRQLATKLAKLETKMESQSLAGGDSLSINSSENVASRLRPDTTGKLELDGSVAQRLETLDKRETELLDEIKQLKATMKKVKEDRQHFRQKSDEKVKEIKLLKKEIADLQVELDQFYEKERLPSARRNSRPSSAERRSPPLSARRGSSLRDRPPSPRDRTSSNRERPPSPRDRAASGRERQTSSRSREERREIERRDRKLEEIRENHAAKTIQRGWRSHKQEEEEHLERDRKVEQFRNDRAARKIQNQWIQHQHDKQERELDDAAMLIQSAARGNEARRRQLQRYQDEEDEDELSDAAELIQSTVRGHWNRKKTINSRSRPSSAERESDGYDSEDAALQIQSAYRGHAARKQYLNNSSSASSRPPSARSSSSRSVSQKSQASPRRRQSSLDSAGEEENISDETITPRTRRNSGSLKRSQPVKSNTFSRQSPQRPSRAQSTVDSEDDDDIMF